MTIRTLTTCLAGSLALAAAAGAEIIESLWIGPDGGNWNNMAHWDPMGVPDNGADTFRVTIGDGGPDMLVVIDSNVAIDALTIDAGDMLRMPNSRNMTIVGGPFLNNGTVDMDGTTHGTRFYFDGGSVSLTGGGLWDLSNRTSNRLSSHDGSRIINVDNTISGAGIIGDGDAAFTNHGLVEAIHDGQPMIIETLGGSDVFNTGLMRATGGGELRFDNPFVDNTDGAVEIHDASLGAMIGAALTGGTVDVLGGGELRMSNSSITGGTLTNSDGGVIRAFLGTSTLGGTVTNPVGGLIQVDTARLFRLLAGSTYTNEGTIAINGASHATGFEIEGGVVELTGGGTIAMTDRSVNRLRSTDDSRLVSDQVIEGSGAIGDNKMSFTNLGTVSAIHAGKTLEIDPVDSGDVVNAGLIRAIDGAELFLDGGLFENSDGVIEVHDASAGRVRDSEIVGGVVDVFAGGELRLEDANLNDVTLTNTDGGVIRAVFGTSTLGGSVTNPVGGTLVADTARFFELLAGSTYDNAGTIEINGASHATGLTVAGGVVELLGGGAIVMSDRTVNRLRSTDDSRLVCDHVIEGTGNIGDDKMSFTNLGTVSAIHADKTLEIDPLDAGDVVNAGLFRAIDGAELFLDDGFCDNIDGVIEIHDASVGRIRNVEVVGGAIDVLPGGELRLENSVFTDVTLVNTDGGVIRAVDGFNTLGGSVTNPVGGQLVADNARYFRLVAGSTYDNAGTIAINATTHGAGLIVDGGVVELAGGGTVELTDDTTGRMASNDDGTLVNVDHTIRGAGRIGDGSMGLVNQATIIANGERTLRIGTNASGFDNQATLRAEGVGGVRIDGPFTTTGDVAILDGSLLHRAGASYMQDGGTTTVDGTLEAAQGVDLDGGELRGSGVVDAEVRNNGGIIGPGASAGILTIAADLVCEPDGAYRAELGGLVPGDEHDQLVVQETAMLGGSLVVELLDDYEPQFGDTFVILTAELVLGTFECLDFPVLEKGGFLIHYSATDVTLEVGTPNPFDVTGDGIVNFNDLLAVLASWGPCEGACCPADLDDDGDVDFNDLLLVLSSWD